MLCWSCHLQGCGCGKREGGQNCERDGISISQGLHIYSIKDWSSVWICTVQLLLSDYKFCPRLSVSVLPSPRTRSWLLPTKHSISWRKRPTISECIVNQDMFVVLKYGFTCCKPWCVVFQYSGKGVIVGILKTGQKNLFLCVNIRILISHTVVMFNTLSLHLPPYYRTHVGYSMRCLRCVCLTFMSMSRSKDVAMERSSLRQC